MKKQKILANTLLAVAGLALLACSAAKADTITPAYSDLILGFRVITLYDSQQNALAAQGIGTTTNLTIDLGAASQFYSPSSSSFTLTGLVLQDLIDTYGSNWSTRTDLVWGIIGTTGRTDGTADGHALANTVWATAAEQTAGTETSTPRPKASGNALKTAIGASIEPLFDANSALDGATSTIHSDTAAAIATTEDSSWSSRIGAYGTFGLSSPSVEGSTAVSAGGFSVLDLFELQAPSAFSSTNSTSTYLGSFGLSSDGVLTFSTDAALFAAVPEPSTYALLGLAGCLWAFKSRRHALKA